MGSELSILCRGYRNQSNQRDQTNGREPYAALEAAFSNSS